MSKISGVGGGYSTTLRQVSEKHQQAAQKTSQGNEKRFRLIDRTADPLSAQGLRGDPKLGSEVGTSVDKVMRKVSEYQADADKMVIDLATGRDTNIHNTMLELEKADIAFKYAVQLRNRALDAYQELMRIQI